ncbi:serine hydrolase domain-containing protein [Pseudonocardia endophytica]|uniref:CubicO group peptidase (Beta-lactamase class C family) n=1 Tax=Pseudonocardia endophytica TaxID=401976 RepID=A0A4R1HQC6_PSEEN|nr:serine hydrolase domain-containing protein [Pseudonocardia endophytica]TCK22915.1 CubicO group peptidase (beta-lactamase class C family) [Pseudonocardia endophytica]
MIARGSTAPGFGAVADAFADVMAGSAGAFSVVRGGDTLVELYGGRAPSGPTGAGPDGRSWDADTVAVLFSGTKGLAATACAALAGPAPHGLDPDEPVARYWPEFAAAGKESVTVGQVLSHTAGLPSVDPAPAAIASDLDDRAGAAALAQQGPLWKPGTRTAYHALTYGHLVAELLRRVTGRDPRAVVEEVVARVPGVRVFLRTPPPAPARILRCPGYRLSTFLDGDPDRRAAVDRMYRALSDPELVNTPAWYRSGALAGAGVAGATSMARLYAALADPARSPVPAAALARATTTHAEGVDAINDRPLRYGLGFELADPIGTYGPEPVAFGHSGAGGGRHGAWPERRIGFSFLPGELRTEDADDRASTLLTALHTCL